LGSFSSQGCCLRAYFILGLVKHTTDQVANADHKERMSHLLQTLLASKVKDGADMETQGAGNADPEDVSGLCKWPDICNMLIRVKVWG